MAFHHWFLRKLRTEQLPAGKHQVRRKNMSIGEDKQWGEREKKKPLTPEKWPYKH